MLIKKVEIFDIDDLIAKQIMDLNNKGYVTEYCCSGHEKNRHYVGNRISFGTYVLFNSLSSVSVKTTPNNWVLDEVGNRVRIGREFTKEETDIFTDYQLLLLASRELYTWVKGLESIKGYSYIEVEEYKG